LDSSHNGGLSKATQISSGATILEGTPASVSKTAIKQLQTLQVAITLETKILGSAKMSDGRTELTLSDGQKITTDLYIPTVGVVPNSAYVPPNLLNSKGFVVVDDFLQVKGVKDVWAVGDISAVQRPQYVNMDKQSAHVAKNIGLLMQGRELAVYKPAEKGTFVFNLP
jgi:NADH dehydrogenase FAD-containing subunit